ncbi:MAG: LacI family DNA-binding transcriptional regulator [Solirubrobacteraceae bacterium]
MNVHNPRGRGTAGTGARRRRGPAMGDVARLAGVSHQTVSRVINDSEHVSPQTRKRVLEAMQKLDYRPSSIARALVTGRTNTIGVVSFDTTLHGPASTMFGIERAAHRAGYFTTTVSLQSLDRPSIDAAVTRLSGQGVEGILVIAAEVQAVKALPDLPRDVPIVAVEAGPDKGISVVAIDQRAGAVAATRHLLDLGHRTVSHIAGPPDWQETRLRLAGWRKALAAAGAEVTEPLTGDWSPRSGYELARDLLSSDTVTAIFVANDQMALGALRALHEAGRRVPRDISIVGFDDIPESAFFTPPLTTVRQDFLEMGERGFELLRRAVETSRTVQRRELIKPELVVRASTAAPRDG